MALGAIRALGENTPSPPSDTLRVQGIHNDGSFELHGDPIFQKDGSDGSIAFEFRYDEGYEPVGNEPVCSSWSDDGNDSLALQFKDTKALEFGASNGASAFVAQFDLSSAFDGGWHTLCLDYSIAGGAGEKVARCFLDGTALSPSFTQDENDSFQVRWSAMAYTLVMGTANGDHPHSFSLAEFWQSASTMSGFDNPAIVAKFFSEDGKPGVKGDDGSIDLGGDAGTLSPNLYMSIREGDDWEAFLTNRANSNAFWSTSSEAPTLSIPNPPGGPQYAMATLTVDGFLSQGDTLAMSDQTYTLVPRLTEWAATASATLTFDGIPAIGETVTVDGITYTFVEWNFVFDAPNQVSRGQDPSDAPDNLERAINGDDGEGSNYSEGTQQPESCGANNRDEGLVVEANDEGAAGNSIAVSTTMDNGSWSSDQLTGGIDAGDPVANELVIPDNDGDPYNSSVVDMLANLLSDFDGQGDSYSSNTEQPTGVTLFTRSENDSDQPGTVTIRATSAGTSGNSIPVDASSSALSWDGDHLTGGT